MLLQIPSNWCLPSDSGHNPYAATEQAIMLLLFILIGIMYFRNMNKNLSYAKVSEKRIDLMASNWFKNIIKSKYFPLAIRSFSAFLFILVIITGLLGRKYTSLSAGLTWLFWWTILIFLVAFLGKIFCAACPWDFFANLFQFNWFHRRKGEMMGLHLKWPKALSNIYVAITFFILLTWFELGFDISRNSYTTAILGLTVVGLAIVCALVFEKRSFCRYACPVGRISGLYAQFSPLELRTRDKDICTSCHTKECVRGTDETTGCPTGEIPFNLNQNTYCTLCTECVRSCPHDNLTLKMRPPGADLGNIINSRSDESILAVFMLVLTLFHGLTMTPFWLDSTSSLSLNLHITYLQGFTLLMAGIMAGGFILYWIFEKGVGLISREKNLTKNMAYVFIPIALGYHLGHNSMHLFVESPHLITLFNDPFGYGWDLFGWANVEIKPLLSFDTLRFLQLTVVLIGFYFSVKTLRNRIEQITSNSNKRRIVFLSYLLTLIAIGILAMWFIYQPMVMKSVGV